MNQQTRSTLDTRAVTTTPAATQPGHADVLAQSALNVSGEQAILVPPAGCPSAAGFRGQVAAMEAQASTIVSGCINPLCPFGMHMQGKTSEKLTIV